MSAIVRARNVKFGAQIQALTKKIKLC